MGTRVTASDPSVSFDSSRLELAAATILKAAGITTQAQIDALVATFTPGNIPSLPAAFVHSVRVLAGGIRIDP